MIRRLLPFVALTAWLAGAPAVAAAADYHHIHLRRDVGGPRPRSGT